MRHCHPQAKPVTLLFLISSYFLSGAATLGKKKPCGVGDELVQRQLSNSYWLRTQEAVASSLKITRQCHIVSVAAHHKTLILLFPVAHQQALQQGDHQLHQWGKWH